MHYMLDLVMFFLFLFFRLHQILEFLGHNSQGTRPRRETQRGA